MSELYAFVLTFASEHPFLFWCTLWLLWGPVGIILALCELTLKVWTRALRLLMVSFRGWPPPHLDADGDWRSVETKVNPESDSQKL